MYLAMYRAPQQEYWFLMNIKSAFLFLLNGSTGCTIVEFKSRFTHVGHVISDEEVEINTRQVRM
jgi:hypothetical protein